MESVLRVMVIYSVLLLLFRVSGKRTLSDTTTFDLLLLLVLSETVQQALVGEDRSITHAVLLATTFIMVDVTLSLIKQRSRKAANFLEGAPILVASNGELLHNRMNGERVDEDDLLEAARAAHGLERLDQIKCAILERNGQITIVPNSTVQPKPDSMS